VHVVCHFVISLVPKTAVVVVYPCPGFKTSYSSRGSQGGSSMQGKPPGPALGAIDGVRRDIQKAKEAGVAYDPSGVGSAWTHNVSHSCLMYQLWAVVECLHSSFSLPA
jgi:hypothetical protein